MTVPVPAESSGEPSPVPELSRREIAPLIAAALHEDAPEGDITSQALVPAEAVTTALLRAREEGVFSGGPVLLAAFAEADPCIGVRILKAEGETFSAGETLAEVRGPARGILLAERVALNLVQRMSGIATAARAYVREVAGTGARITDTRKTTPGLRRLERHAVRCGGGRNHRASLSQAFMAKDNHLALAGDVTAALRRARRALPHTVHMEVEVDRLDQLPAVLAAEAADTILLDNFGPEELREGVRLIGGRALVEASGGVTLGTVREIALAGVDLISVGALTHHVRALDLGLDIETPAGGASAPSEAASAEAARP